jgi:hypothetical protein
LLALLGKEEKVEKAGATSGDAEMKSDSESSGDEQGYDEDDGEQSEKFSLGSESEGEESDSDSSDSSDEEEKGTDMLMADEMDIPRVDDIPIVSKLAKEKKEI